MGLLSESLGAQVGLCVHTCAKACPAQNSQLTALKARVALVYVCYYSLGKYVSNNNVSVKSLTLMCVLNAWGSY